MKRIKISNFGFRISDFRVSRRGFTLVELMVSVTLAIIILTLFATIYSWSTDTYATQKGIRRNDQRSRMMVTVIKGDLNNRTFVDVVPFWPGQRTDSAPPAGDLPPGPRYNAAEREGYFGISENDPNNHADDVLILTVKIPKDSRQRLYTGRATLIRPNAPPPPPSDAQYLAQNPNQPEGDDGQYTVNGGMLEGVLNSAGSSRSAEIAYFLRNGNLYRRVLLIREPYDGPGAPSIPAQPTGLTGIYDQTKTTTGSGIFWRDFAYSAYFDGEIKFHGMTTPNSLDNQNPASGGVTSGTPSFPISLGMPPLRFGYSLTRTLVASPPSAPAPQLLPREYVGSAFIGRFLTQETGDAAFLYPGSLGNPPDAATNDPHVRSDLTYDTATGLVSEYSANTVTRGEDILMTNVHEFDVKVWDRNLSRFVDLGHQEPGVLGEFHMSNNLRRPDFPDTGTAKYAWNRFDTWHPYFDNTANVDRLGPPPYKSKRRDVTTAVVIKATGKNDPPLGADEKDLNGNGTLETTEDTYLNGQIDEEQPLLAVQITIRFFDVATKQMRQLTIQHSLKKNE